MIFNVEVFSALNAVVAVQNASKVTTTLAMAAVDIGQSIVALRDIDKMTRGINRICGPLGAQYTANAYMMIPSEVDQPAQGRERSSSHNAIRLLKSVSSKLQITDPTGSA